MGEDALGYGPKCSRQARTARTACCSSGCSALSHLYASFGSLNGDLRPISCCSFANPYGNQSQALGIHTIALKGFAIGGSLNL